ncbi:MAG: IS1595 family transposase, partial [Candidatus Limnocylindria bacterium]
MSQVNRNQPRRGTASESRYTLFEFEKQFPDDAACLDYLMAERYPSGVLCPKCQKVTKHYREKARPSWSCEFCGHRVHPMVGTIFEDSATSLRLWFYAIYLMASTRCGISAKQLERELGVTYKTAWRMFHQIRSLLVQGDAPIGGEGEIIEADEAFIGGLSKWRNHGKPKGKGGGWVGKQPVHGFVQRGHDGKIGKIRARVLPQSATDTFTAQVTESVHVRVLPKSSLFTDTYVAYDHMGERGYKHKRINHTRRVYVDGIVHTNT